MHMSRHHCTHAIIGFLPLAVIAFVVALFATILVAQTILALVLTAIARRAAAGAAGKTLILLSIAGGCKERGKYDGEDLHCSIGCLKCRCHYFCELGSKSSTAELLSSRRNSNHSSVVFVVLQASFKASDHHEKMTVRKS